MTVHDINAKAQREALENFELRILELETRVQTLTGQTQTLINLMTQLQQSNALALQKILGSGSTS